MRATFNGTVACAMQPANALATMPVYGHPPDLGHRLYLRLGDKVSHQRYGRWGEGTVVEEMTSTVPGGTCLVRIQFDDGHERVFHNDLDNEMCCYYFGIRKFWSIDPETFEPQRARRTARPRRIGSRNS